MRSVRRYDTEHLEAGLLELACWHGSAENASRSLLERGIKIPPTTLQTWKTSHAERLAEVEARVLPEIRARLAAHQELVARRASEVTLRIIERTAENIDEIPARDLPGAARNMEVTAATAIDKHSVIHEFPTEIVRRDSAEDILKRLAQKHPGMFVEGTAEEIPTVDVVEDTPAEGAVRELARGDSQLNALG